ncbi:sensor histidine kinase [Streptomyces rhizoryzae]|uniref:sensor histidine kinase n=1 Tax=Streptomyces rhizoryzae TaxID=2932493 RepID=UPI00249EAFA4|nr:ATP-binding protein [Streptomyces rhizoryzae]
MPTATPPRTETSQEAPRSHGGRHGRAAFPEPGADAAIRSRLVRLAAVPALLTAVVCTGAAAFTVHSGGARLTGREWTVLAGGLVVVCGIVLFAGLAGNAEARALANRCARLRLVCARARNDIADLLDRVRDDAWLRPREDHEPLPEPGGDPFGLLAHDVAAAGRAAEAALIEAVGIVRSDATGDQQKLEVFVNLARRLQSLVHRQILTLDELEYQVEDPDLLKGLFVIDHLATRIRRHAENLAVLGGAITRRQWTRPITMTEVVRSSTAEVEQYTRIKLVSPFEGTLRGHAVADVVHLLAELVENATEFSDPGTPVTVRARHVTAGLAVEVEDRGLGMSAEEQEQMNRLLADPEHIDLTELLDDGRIGLYVVSSLAQRHGIVVRLQGSIYGGVQAVLIVPPELLGANSAETREEFPDGMEDEDVPAPVRSDRAHGDRFDDATGRRAPAAAGAPGARALAPVRALPAGPGALPAAPGALPGRRRIVRTPAGATAAAVEAAATSPQHTAATPDGPRPGGHHPADHRSLEPRPADRGTDPFAPSDYRPAGPGPAIARTTGYRPGEPAPSGHRPLEPRPADHRPDADDPSHYRPAGPAPATARPAGVRYDDPSRAGTRAPCPPGHDTSQDPDPGPAPDPGPVLLPPAPLPFQEGPRPRLPRRIKQAHIAPQLRDGPPPQLRRSGPERLHDPHLMAAYQRGFSRGDPSYAAGLTAAGHPAPGPATTPGQDGEAGGPGDPGPLLAPDHDAPMARPRGDDPDHGE